MLKRFVALFQTSLNHGTAYHPYEEERHVHSYLQPTGKISGYFDYEINIPEDF